jgi:hypothetical protein
MNHNILSIINERGKPTVFISAVFNGNCNQIASQLMKDQSYKDRPDVVSDVFKTKLQQLVLNLRNGTYFNGNMVEYIFYSVTWKKGKIPIVNILAKLLNETDISFSQNPHIIMDLDGYIKFHCITNSIDLTKYIQYISKAEIKSVLQIYVN